MTSLQFSVANFRLTQATLEAFGGFICLLLAIILLLNGHRKKSWKLLNAMYFSVAGSMFSESVAYVFGGNPGPLSAFIAKVSNFTVFFLNIVLLILFTEYLYSFLQEKGVAVSKAYRRMVFICAALNVALLFSNALTRWMYFFDEANQYHRGMGWYMFTLLNLLCILVLLRMVLRHRSAMSKGMLGATIFYIVVPILAIILQAFVYGIACINLGLFIALIATLLAYLMEWHSTEEVEQKKRKLIQVALLFSFMTISMSMALASCVISIMNISDKNAENNSQLVAHTIRSSISGEFLQPMIVAKTIVHDSFMKEYLRQGSATPPQAIEADVAAYLNSIRTGFGYQMVYAVCDASQVYYTYHGISRVVDASPGSPDTWYQDFLAKDMACALNVDTDRDNGWELSVFFNCRITDDDGSLLGVCGVGVKVDELRQLLRQYEEAYNVTIHLIDQSGLVQLSSDSGRIEADTLAIPYLSEVSADSFTYEPCVGYNRMTVFMPDLNWFLVVDDHGKQTISVMEIAGPSIIIFGIGLIVMGITFFVIIIREEKASRELMQKRKMSMIDDLTGLYNRRAFEEDCSKLQESGGISRMTIVWMDINGLKCINDTYGHQFGDDLIIAAAKCIQSPLAEYGKIYRIGGDEFVALLESTQQQLDSAMKTLDHLAQSWHGDFPGELAISKGIVVCAEHPQLSFRELKQLADQQMYADKSAYYRCTGKDRRRH